MASSPSEVDEIRRYMAQIRHELHQDVQGVVKGAEATTDWRRYVRNYPWAAMGIAFGVGFLIVPRRHREPKATIQYAGPEPSQQPVAVAAPAAVEPPKKQGKGLFKTALGFAAPFVLRTVQGYALQFFEQYLAQKMAQQQNPFADFAASFMPNGASPPPDDSNQPVPPRFSS